MTFKEKIYAEYVKLVNEKFNLLQQKLQELSDSAKNETKSTAGDKHETALAMLQIEQENTRNKLSEILEQQKQLSTININILSNKIIKGSLIKTDQGFLFLSIALGKIIVDEKQVISLSTLSPLGTKLLGMKINETVEINKIKYHIKNIS